MDFLELQHFIEPFLVLTVSNAHPGISEILPVGEGITGVILLFKDELSLFWFGLG